ncbi:MAG: hypothetical protein J6U23_03800 [Clostridiales bacterium]|nr:hypothetical protein [Clostridiales bacterium]
MGTNIDLNKLSEYANDFNSKKPGYNEAQYLISGSGDALAQINSCLVLVDQLGKKTDDMFVASANYLKKACANYNVAEKANSKEAQSGKKK